MISDARVGIERIQRMSDGWYVTVGGLLAKVRKHGSLLAGDCWEAVDCRIERRGSNAWHDNGHNIWGIARLDLVKRVCDAHHTPSEALSFITTGELALIEGEERF